jgi:hypothetical protein
VVDCGTYLVEVDVHALELEIGGTIVPSEGQYIVRDGFARLLDRDYLHAGAIETVLARDGLPVVKSIAIRCRRILLGWTHQKAAPIWLP